LSDHPEQTIAFYRAVGVPFEDEDHGDGLIHAAADVDDVHFAVFVPSSGAGSSPEWRSCGSTFVGFYVISLEATLKSLRALGSKLLVDHQVRPWACRDSGGPRRSSGGDQPARPLHRGRRTLSRYLEEVGGPPGAGPAMSGTDASRNTPVERWQLMCSSYCSPASNTDTSS
jgi:hypothetical protein